MKIGIIADTHNNFDNTEWALEQLRKRNVTYLIHCGDITEPIMMELFRDFRTNFVLGNMDRARAALRAQTNRGDPLTFTFTIEQDGKAIAVTHGHHHDELNTLINSGDYDYVLHGHTHLRRDERIGRTRIINPGALGGSKKQTRSFCILDPAVDELTFVEKPS